MKNVKYWPIVQPFIGLLMSRKFLVLFGSALVSAGVLAANDLEQWIPIVIMVAAAVQAAMTAWEDTAQKKANGG